MALCPFLRYSLPLKPCVPSTTFTVICPIYGPMSLYDPLPLLCPSATSTTLYPLCGTLPPLQPSVLSTALCLVYSPLSPLRPSEKQWKTSETTPLVLWNVLWNKFCKNPSGYNYLFCISDNGDQCNYRSCAILGNNWEKAIINLAKKVAIITSNKKW